MNIAVSAIGWNENEELLISEILNRNNIQHLEITPTYFSRIQNYNGLTYVNINNSMYQPIAVQSLFWGVENVSMFGDKVLVDNFRKVMCERIETASKLNISRIVFGSPKNRKIDSLDNYYKGVELFKFLGDYALKFNVVICVEPNPTIYGTNFLNTTNEAFEFIRQVNHENVRINLDLSTITCNGEILPAVNDVNKFAGHCHISEPFLHKINSKNKNHERYSRVLAEAKLQFVSIEISRNSIMNLIELEESIIIVNEIYGH